MNDTHHVQIRPSHAGIQTASRRHQRQNAFCPTRNFVDCKAMCPSRETAKLRRLDRPETSIEPLQLSRLFCVRQVARKHAQTRQAVYQSRSAAIRKHAEGRSAQIPVVLRIRHVRPLHVVQEHAALLHRNIRVGNTVRRSRRNRCMQRIRSRYRVHHRLRRAGTSRRRAHARVRKRICQHVEVTNHSTDNRIHLQSLTVRWNRQHIPHRAPGPVIVHPDHFEDVVWVPCPGCRCPHRIVGEILLPRTGGLPRRHLVHLLRGARRPRCCHGVRLVDSVRPNHQVVDWVGCVRRVRKPLLRIDEERHIHCRSANVPAANRQLPARLIRCHLVDVAEIGVSNHHAVAGSIRVASKCRPVVSRTHRLGIEVAERVWYQARTQHIRDNRSTRSCIDRSRIYHRRRRQAAPRARLPRRRNATRRRDRAQKHRIEQWSAVSGRGNGYRCLAAHPCRRLYQQE